MLNFLKRRIFMTIDVEREFELSKKEMIPKSPVMHYAMVRKPNLTNTKEL